MPDAKQQRTGHRGQSRVALLAALAEVFETMGYDGATLTQLAAATSLGKASLYHHFPGGKAEMAAVLLRDAVADLERTAFSHLNGNAPPRERLTGFVDGFREYVQDGQRACLIAVFSEGSAGAVHGETIASQYTDWLRRLAATFEESGQKPKRSERAAAELLAALYGNLVTARLIRQPGLFKRQVKRLAKRLKQSLPA